MTTFTILGRGKAGRALATAMGVDNLAHDARPEGWVVLAVPDHAIAALAEHFKNRCVHLSGSLNVPGVPCLHPLNSFDGSPRDWTGTPLALTGGPPAHLVEAFARVGFAPFELAPEHKALYHAAAVLTAGHAATLWLGAHERLEAAGVHLPGRGLWPLAEAALDNAQRLGRSGRTGPFARGDEATIERDADALDEPWRTIFLTLGRALDE